MCIRDSDRGDQTFFAEIGPFEERDTAGNPFIEVGITVEVTYIPLGGGSEQVTRTREFILPFDMSGFDVDDNHQSDDKLPSDEHEEKDRESAFDVWMVIPAIIVILYLSRRIERF